MPKRNFLTVRFLRWIFFLFSECFREKKTCWRMIVIIRSIEKPWRVFPSNFALKGFFFSMETSIMDKRSLACQGQKQFPVDCVIVNSPRRSLSRKAVEQRNMCCWNVHRRIVQLNTTSSEYLRRRGVRNTFYSDKSYYPRGWHFDYNFISSFYK